MVDERRRCAEDREEEDSDIGWVDGDSWAARGDTTSLVPAEEEERFDDDARREDNDIAEEGEQTDVVAAVAVVGGAATTPNTYEERKDRGRSARCSDLRLGRGGEDV
jgi:hypothetical protein